ncbi:sugar phosphate isomerase/epimerase [Tardiphaga sp. vice154]|uniref:sugar phosphate isomerase/epimerase family protein n=1 Tax=unclassified Tardiphaga TaxID=2631404 RepID=UPI0011656F83|nr:MULTISPECIES: TIM barrel protein [unclassified Tardiphaga]MBC7585302.1 sugar phosphate isomerase/epimerase [Tardiphaga sp.]QDM22081.1 sugar phosphate isomerase/epimerase [Tardiphaga sp. vice154]
MIAKSDLPVVGAALSMATLAIHRDWILEKQRDLEIQDFFRSETLDGDWRAVADGVRRLLDGYTGRLGMHGPFWGFKIDSQDPLIRAVVTKRLLQGLDACEAIGATQMVIHSPFTTWDYNNLDINPGAREALAERVHQTLRDVVQRAEGIGCELVIENIEDIDPMARVLLARSFDSAAVRVSIDTGHAYYAHVSTGAPPVDYYVDAAGADLAHVHIQDADGYSDRHWLPGDGTLNWNAVFKALGRLSHRPRLLIEVKDQANIRRGAAHLEALGLAL